MDRDLRALSDLELRDRVVAGGDAPWRELLRRYDPLIWKAAASAPDPEDARGEALLRLLEDDCRRLRAWDPARGARLASWIYVLVQHVALDARRKRSGASKLGRVRVAVDLEHVRNLPAADPSPEERAVVEDAMAAVRRALTPQQQRRLHVIMGDVCDRPRGMAQATFYTTKYKLIALLQQKLAA